MIDSRLLGTTMLLLSAILVRSHAAPPTTSATGDATFDLLTENEAVRWNADKPRGQSELRARDLPVDDGTPRCDSSAGDKVAADGPRINILAPSLAKPLTAPLDIDLQFIPTGSAGIRPDTFRVCYKGFLTIDITKRVTDHVLVTADGVHIPGVQLPRGHHHLVMLIADRQGHIGSGDFVFDIH